MKKLFNSIKMQLRALVLLTIKIYQKTLSFDHGPLAKMFPFWGCRYFPTCSEYTYQAVAKYGIFKGLYLGARRLIRCQPLAKGGHDPVP